MVVVVVRSCVSSKTNKIKSSVQFMRQKVFTQFVKHFGISKWNIVNRKFTYGLGLNFFSLILSQYCSEIVKLSTNVK